MRVAVLGGYGAFGARLARLLCRDGHEVIIAGRSHAKAAALAGEIGATPLSLDRGGDLAALWAAAPEAVVDAAGPFHGYGDDPYALPRACIARGVHYLDLADDAAFCAGIAALDDDARAAGVFALSGVSSVPCISSAAVAHLADGADEIDTISTAILPGNRAPRGRAVVESILHQCGLPLEVMQDGAPDLQRSWSRPADFLIERGVVRRGWMIGVPDQVLFPKFFGARTVLFRAGLELGVMNYGLAALSWLRGWLGFGMPRWLISLMLFAARMLTPFGSDEGGMSVTVTARFGDRWEEHVWRLFASAGEGPFVPGVAARAILRAPEAVAAGARPAVAAVPLAQVTAAMDDLAITTETAQTPVTPLFVAQLGEAFGKLPKAVQAAHLVYGARRFVGRGRVARGQGWYVRLIAAVFRFPPAVEDIPVTVLMTPEAGGEVWERQFGTQKFRSVLRREGRMMTERFGPFIFTLGLHGTAAGLRFPVKFGRLGWLPLPQWALPRSEALEFERDGKFHFDVALHAPITGALVVHYTGTLARHP